MWDPPEPPTGGARGKLSLNAIVDGAIRLADAQGLEALSMRKVAAAIGSGTMSLYNYVAGKDELLELMIDRIYAEVPVPDPEASWREQVLSLVRGEWDLFQRHPWVLQTNLTRLALGPNLMDHAERMYKALESFGLTGEDNARSARLISSYLQGEARNWALEQQATITTGESIDDYYAARQEFWETYFDVQRYPVHTRIWTAGGFDIELSEVDYGLNRLLDSIELLKSPA